MNITYDELVERMNNKFTELSGYAPEKASDIGIRLRLLAGELYSLSTNIDWIKKQMFPNTASGKQLDLHAQQRGLKRQTGKKAKGSVAFMLDMPVEYNVIVPAGTICTTADGTLNYVTTEEYTIRRGSTVLMANCEAEHSGKKYNIGMGKIKTIVTYFSVGISINNSSSFTGGTDDEDDEALRKRIEESYRLTPNGANAAFFESVAEGIDGIQSANVYRPSAEPGRIVVILGGRGEAPSSESFAAASEALENAKPLGIDILVENTSTLLVNVSVNIAPEKGYNWSNVRANAEECIRKFFLDISVGENVRLSALGKALLETEGVSDYSFENMEDTEIPNAFMAVLGTLNIGLIS